jgi:hypothetical protein
MDFLFSSGKSFIKDFKAEKLKDLSANQNRL